jgi:hypothetical protein
MLGSGALSETTTPIPTLASGVTESSVTRPSAASDSMLVVGRTRTSNASPVLTRWLSAPAVSLITVTLWPVCFSKSASTSSSAGLYAPAVNTFSVSADAAPTPASSSSGTSSRRIMSALP